MAAISAVVFDMYGTLTPNWPREFWDEQKRPCAAALGLSEERWIEALDATWHERVIGQFGGLADTFREVAARAGHSPTDAQIDASVAARYEAYTRIAEFRPDALETIEALRRDGLRIALVSDCTGELPDLWDGLGLAALFDVTVFSCHEGTRKPDPKLFLAAAERLGVPPEECLYVGDGGGDELAGSRAVGMTPVLLAGEDWEIFVAMGRSESAWTGLRAAALSEIPSILEAVRTGG